MRTNMNNKTIIVTGGSRGIGRSISEIFAQKGAKIIALYRSDTTSAEKCIEALEGFHHFKKQVDITDPEAISNLWQWIDNEGLKVDVVINNAGIGYHHPVDKVTYDEWQKGFTDIIQTNLIAASNMCYHAAQHMIKNGGGKNHKYLIKRSF